MATLPASIAVRLTDGFERLALLRTSRPLAIAAGGVIALLALTTTALLPPLAERSTFLLPLAGVILSVHVGGWHGGAANILCTVPMAALLLPSFGAFSLSAPGDVLRGGVFLAVALTLTTLAALVDRAHSRLRRTEALSAVIVENAPVLMAGADENGKTVLFNPACAQLTGFSAADMLGRPLAMLVPDDSREAVANRLTSGTPETLATPHENPWLTPKGERAIEWRCFRVPGPDGRPMTLGIGQDVTDRRRLEAAMASALAREQLAREQAEAADATKEKFIATLSHELRGPVTAALGWMRLLRPSLANDSGMRAAAAVERNLRLVASLVDDVLEFTRLELGKAVLTREPIEMARFLTETTTTVEPAAAVAGVGLDVVVADGLPCVYGDPKRLQQIVLNLLNNAIKFTPPGGHVQVTAAPAATDVVEICVSDTGIGIAPDALQKVFEPFYQSADRRLGTPGGLGLGLPLVKELVEAHGGSVSVSSDGPDRGTLVHVRLPAASSGAAELAG